MRTKKYPSKEYLLSIYDYVDGKLYHSKNHRIKRYAGKRAGSVQRAGYKEYRQVKHLGELYYEHRVIWIMHYGEIPKNMQIDHINGCGKDNRVENLRLVCVVENNRNKRRSSRGSASGYTGVTFDKHAGHWKAHIQVDGKHINLGGYKTPEEAYKARRSADEKYGFDAAHGASAL